MKVKIKITHNLSLIFYLFFSLIIWKQINLYKNETYENWIWKINVVILLVLIVQMIVLKVNKKNIFSYNGLFLIFTYLFHLSYQFLFFINYDFQEMSYGNPIKRYGLDYFKESVNISLISAMLLFAGILIMDIFHKEKQAAREIINLKDTKLAAGLIFAGSAPFELYALVSRLSAMRSSGYSGTHEVEMNSLINFMCYMFIVGVFLLICYNKNNKKFARMIFIAFVLYKIFSMFTGLRGIAIIEIMLMTYLYCKIVEKPSFSQALFGSVFIYFLLSFLIVIRRSRSDGLGLESLVDIFTLKENILFNTMSEFGFTINVVCITLLSDVKHVTGSQSIFGILAIIPGAGTFFEAQAGNIIYEALSIQQYGASFIADALFDFGSYFGIFVFVIGLAVGYLSNFIEDKIKTQEYISIGLFLPLIIDFLFCVRSSTYKLPRVLAWSFITIMVIKLIIKYVFHRN